VLRPWPNGGMAATILFEDGRIARRLQPATPFEAKRDDVPPAGGRIVARRWTFFAGRTAPAHLAALSTVRPAPVIAGEKNA
jgi:hypothetical protein